MRRGTYLTLLFDYKIQNTKSKQEGLNSGSERFVMLEEEADRHIPAEALEEAPPLGHLLSDY